jgi:hypothetical protein
MLQFLHLASRSISMIKDMLIGARLCLQKFMRGHLPTLSIYLFPEPVHHMMFLAPLPMSKLPLCLPCMFLRKHIVQ